MFYIPYILIPIGVILSIILTVSLVKEIKRPKFKNKKQPGLLGTNLIILVASDQATLLEAVKLSSKIGIDTVAQEIDKTLPKGKWYFKTTPFVVSKSLKR